MSDETNANQPTQLNLTAIKAMLDALSTPKLYCIHIDYALPIFREFRKHGYELERGKHLDGTKNAKFTARHNGRVLFDIYVDEDTQRTRRHGNIIEIKPPSWTFERPHFEFKRRDDVPSWWITSTLRIAP